MVVTGASSGIGRAFCTYFARNGLHVLAVARREAELAKLCSESSNPENIKVLSLDLSAELGVNALFRTL